MEVVQGLAKPAAYVLCKVNRRARSLLDAKHRLAESGGRIRPFEIPTYEDFAAAADIGVGIMEIKGAKGADDVSGVVDFCSQGDWIVSGFQLTKNAVRQKQATGGERKAAIITAEVALATKDDYIREITSLWNDARQRFLLIGRYLNRAKEQLPHGEFQAMLRAELPFSEQVAFQMRSVVAAIDEGPLCRR